MGVTILPSNAPIRYLLGQKWCPKCYEFKNPDEYEIGAKGFGTFCKTCGGRVRNRPRQRRLKEKYLECVKRY